MSDRQLFILEAVKFYSVAIHSLNYSLAFTLVKANLIHQIKKMSLNKECLPEKGITIDWRKL